MTHGKTLRIYLADGVANGIRHAEIVNWTGQAIVCPRGRIGELATWEESDRPGVYILLGDDPNGPRPKAYIGEAESVFTRLKGHTRKDFWDQVVLFTSKDENLTKAHVKYLESRMVRIAREVERCVLENGTDPGEPRLPRADRAAMEEFLGHLRLLLAAVGVPILQSLRRETEATGSAGPLADIELRFDVDKRGVHARAFATDEGFVVQEGSVGYATNTSLSKGWKALRTELIEDGSLVATGTKLTFARDVVFRSGSAAAAILSGGARNGRKVWKTIDGRTLGDLEQALLKPE